MTPVLRATLGLEVAMALALTPSDFSGRNELSTKGSPPVPCRAFSLFPFLNYELLWKDVEGLKSVNELGSSQLTFAAHKLNSRLF